MTRGRKPNPPPVPPADDLNRTALAEDGAALTELGRRSTAVAVQYGDGAPYGQGRVIGELRFFLAAGAEAMLEMGKRLILLRENEPHGEFTRIVTEQLGIGERSARQMMQVAVRFLGSPKRQAFAVLDKSKLYELLAEPDETLDVLAEGGTVAGLKLDAIETMTGRELRKALAESKKLLAARDRQLKTKAEVIDGYELAEARRRSANHSEAEAAQLEDLRDVTTAAENALLLLLKTVDDVTALPTSEAAGLAARQSLDYVTQRLEDAARQRGITLNLVETVMPASMEPLQRAAEAAAKRKPR